MLILKAAIDANVVCDHAGRIPFQASPRCKMPTLCLAGIVGRVLTQLCTD